jgi:cell division septum initiation protein DivIVA
LKQVEQLKKEKAELEDKNKELIQKLASKEASAVEAVAKPASPAKTPDVVAPITEEVILFNQVGMIR